MSEFPANPTRFDPYKNFKFRVKWDGKYVAGISKISGLKRTTEVVKEREGGDPSSSHKSPGRTEFEAITLERGVTQDTAFQDWAGQVSNFGGAPGAEASLANFRKDIYLELYNEAGQLVLAYKIFRCWVSEYQALPMLDANVSAVAIEHIKLENEGWERDLSVVEPKEPTLTMDGRCLSYHARSGSQPGGRKRIAHRFIGGSRQPSKTSPARDERSWSHLATGLLDLGHHRGDNLQHDSCGGIADLLSDLELQIQASWRKLSARKTNACLRHDSQIKLAIAAGGTRTSSSMPHLSGCTVTLIARAGRHDTAETR